MARAGDFWAGYRRDEDKTTELLAVLDTALHRFPTQRLGQLLQNATGASDLWEMHDERIIECLQLMMDGPNR